MSYRDFRLADVKRRFSLTTREATGLFSDCPLVAPSDHLVETLRRTKRLGLASANEKARSEFIVAPILAELAHGRGLAVNLFSGVELTVDPAVGLSGTCDFLFSLGPEQLIVEAPIVTLVEAKRDDMAGGLGQCAAEMVAAQLFNERAGNAIKSVYGAVTTGTVWQFLGLSGSLLSIDVEEHGIDRIDRILGILSFMISPNGASLGAGEGA